MSNDPVRVLLGAFRDPRTGWTKCATTILPTFSREFGEVPPGVSDPPLIFACALDVLPTADQPLGSLRVSIGEGLANVIASQGNYPKFKWTWVQCPEPAVVKAFQDMSGRWIVASVVQEPTDTVRWVRAFNKRELLGLQD